jgi:hypothetical protein
MDIGHPLVNVDLIVFLFEKGKYPGCGHDKSFGITDHIYDE